LTPFLPNEKNATGAAVIIAPGGGGVELSMETQGYQVVRWLNERGIAAFVLKYRLVPTPKETSKFLELITKESGTALEGVVSAKAAADAAAAATQDGLDAVSYLRRNAAKWHLRGDRIGLLGFSSGAFTSINVVLACDENNRPDLVGLAYGALADWDEKIPASAPPASIAAATDDHQVPAVQGLMIYKAWLQAKVPAELHVFETGGHGFGVARKGTSSDQWLELFDNWLREHDFAPKVPLSGVNHQAERKD
jgi:acetyl esterase/lipase